MGARIKWTPIGESGTEYVDFSDFGIQRFAGGERTDAERTITPAGFGVVLWHDSWYEYELHVDAIHRITDTATWHQLQSFLAHASAGAAFSFAGESTDDYAAVLTAGAARGTNDIVVADTSGVSSGDSLVLEHALDPRRITVSVTVVTSATELLVTPALHHSLPAGSSVTHWEYFETCRANSKDVKLTERDAGLGANLWDFRIRFRTLRG